MQGELVGNGVLITGRLDLWLCLTAERLDLLRVYFFNWSMSLLAVQRGTDVSANVQALICKTPCFALELDVCEPGLVVVSGVWEAGGSLVPVRT